MSNKPTPSPVVSIMNDLGMNDAEEFFVGKRRYFILSMIDSEGNPLPIGLPIIIEEISSGRFIQLDPDNALKILSKIE